MKVHLLTRSTTSYDKSFEIRKTIDFSGHSLQLGDWSQVHITSKVIVYNTLIHKANDGLTEDTLG